jgi:hypothetical protein
MSKHYHDVFLSLSLSSVLAQEMATQKKNAHAQLQFVVGMEIFIFSFSTKDEKNPHTIFESWQSNDIYFMDISNSISMCKNILWLAHMLSTLLTFFFVCVLFDISFITIRWQLEINYAHLSFPIPPA